MEAGDVVAMFGVDCSSMDTFTDGRYFDFFVFDKQPGPQLCPRDLPRACCVLANGRGTNAASLAEPVCCISPVRTIHLNIGLSGATGTFFRRQHDMLVSICGSLRIGCNFSSFINTRIPLATLACLIPHGVISTLGHRWIPAPTLLQDLKSNVIPTVKMLLMTF